MIRLLTILFLLLPAVAFAQKRDSVFDSYQAYGDYVDNKIMSRDFIPLVQVMGGRDEYTKEQLNGLNTQLLSAFPTDFESSAIFRREDLGGGISQEARIYWTGLNYAFFYALLHERGGELVVIAFSLNSEVAKIMEKF